MGRSNVTLSSCIAKLLKKAKRPSSAMSAGTHHRLQGVCDTACACGPGYVSLMLSSHLGKLLQCTCRSVYVHVCAHIVHALHYRM